MIPRLKEQYDKQIVLDLQKKFSLKNRLMVPKIIKVVLNMGLGKDANDKKIVKNCIDDMSLISGQFPIITKFKKEKTQNHIYSQSLFDYIFNQIEFNFREIGQGDVTVNKNMKNLVKTFYNILLKCEKFEKYFLNIAGSFLK